MHRILIVGPKGTKRGQLLHALQLEDVPVQEMTLCNKYFMMDIGVWMDQYEDVEEWMALWASGEAEEAKAAVRCLLCLQAADADRLGSLFDCDKVLVDGDCDDDALEWEKVHAQDAARLRELIETSVAACVDRDGDQVDLQDSYDTFVSLRASSLDPEEKKTQAMEAIRRLL